MKRLFLILLFLILLSNTAYAWTGSCPLSWPVTSPFGWRWHPIYGGESEKFHSGVDLGAEEGTPIDAMLDGIVIYAGSWGGYGNVVILQHTNDFFTLYGHCSQILVTNGQQVSAEQPIATVGSTGVSTGPHLHLEVWYQNQYVEPIGFLSQLLS